MSLDAADTSVRATVQWRSPRPPNRSSSDGNTGYPYAFLFPEVALASDRSALPARRADYRDPLYGDAQPVEIRCAGRLERHGDACRRHWPRDVLRRRDHAGRETARFGRSVPFHDLAAR